MSFRFNFLAAVIAALVASIPMNAQRPLCCDTEGTILQYEKTEFKKDKIVRYQKMEVLKVEQGSKEEKNVTIRTTLTRPDGKYVYGGPLSTQTKVYANGEIELNLADMATAVIKSLFPKQSVETASVQATLPALLSVGEKLSDIKCEMKIGPYKHTIQVCEREVLRKESLDVPAGTFECYLIREHRIESSILRNKDCILYDWYSPGLGIVRHDNFTPEMKPISSEVLVSITNGKGLNPIGGGADVK